MNFSNIQQKNIHGLNFYGEVLDKAIDRLEEGCHDLSMQSEASEFEKLDRQFLEEKNIKTILVKMPAAVQKISNKQSFLRAVLQEELDSENLKKIKTIRYYVDMNRVFYVQIIFEMN